LMLKLSNLLPIRSRSWNLSRFFPSSGSPTTKRTATARPTLCPVTSRSTAATASVSSMAFVTAVGQ